MTLTLNRKIFKVLHHFYWLSLVCKNGVVGYCLGYITIIFVLLTSAISLLIWWKGLQYTKQVLHIIHGVCELQKHHWAYRSVKISSSMSFGLVLLQCCLVFPLVWERVETLAWPPCCSTSTLSNHYLLPIDIQLAHSIMFHLFYTTFFQKEAREIITETEKLYEVTYT